MSYYNKYIFHKEDRSSINSIRGGIISKIFETKLNLSSNVSSGNEMDEKETSFESVLHIYLNISREKAFGRIIDSG